MEEVRPVQGVAWGLPIFCQRNSILLILLGAQGKGRSEERASAGHQEDIYFEQRSQQQWHPTGQERAVLHLAERIGLSNSRPKTSV